MQICSAAVIYLGLPGTGSQVNFVHDRVAVATANVLGCGHLYPSGHWGHWYLPGTASVDVILTRLFIVCFRAFPPFFKVARALAIYLIDTRILRWMSGHFIYLFMPGYCKSKSSRRFLQGFHIHYICDVCHGLTNGLLCERR